jgi:hypothetical protein
MFLLLRMFLPLLLHMFLLGQYSLTSLLISLLLCMCPLDLHHLGLLLLVRVLVRVLSEVEG